MKKFVLAVVMAMASISVVHAAEFSSLVSFNFNTDKFSPGLGIGTKVGNYGVGYAIMESQRNNLVTHTHVFALSREFYKSGNLSVGIKGGTAYLAREDNPNGWIGHIGPSVSYRLSDDYRIVADLLTTKGGSDLKALDTTLVIVGFRYKF
jgi:hypothetical protein